MLAAAASAAAPGPPEGRFTGTGSWRGPQGSAGQYTVSTEISGRTLKSHYTWADAANRTESVVMTFASPGSEPMFDVLDGSGQTVGKGFCFEGECSYRAEISGVVVQEAVRWQSGRLRKLGSKSGPGFQAVGARS